MFLALHNHLRVGIKQPIGTRKSPGEPVVKDIKQAKQRKNASKKEIRIVLDGLCDGIGIIKLYHLKDIAQSNY